MVSINNLYILQIKTNASYWLYFKNHTQWISTYNCLCLKQFIFTSIKLKLSHRPTSSKILSWHDKFIFSITEKIFWPLRNVFFMLWLDFYLHPHPKMDVLRTLLLFVFSLKVPLILLWTIMASLDSVYSNEFNWNRLLLHRTSQSLYKTVNPCFP